MAIDLNESILRRSVRACSPERAATCSSCRRTPVAGELLHVYEGGASLCALCLPAGGRRPVRSERVHAAGRPLVVVPRAA